MRVWENSMSINLQSTEYVCLGVQLCFFVDTSFIYSWVEVDGYSRLELENS
jgi:hypothetical protein